MLHWVLPLRRDRNCSLATLPGTASNMISSRKVQMAANKGENLAKPDLIAASGFGLLVVVLRHQIACLWHSGAAFPQMGPVGGMGEQDVAHFILGNHVEWGQLYCVYFWVKSPLYSFILENRGAFQFLSEEISLNGSGCQIWGFWDAFCFMFETQLQKQWEKQLQ